MSQRDWIDGFLARERLPASYRETIQQVCVPVVQSLLQSLVAREAGQPGATLSVGLCGSQGSGKSTLSAALVEMLRSSGLTAAALSLDDLYLTRLERMQLAARVHPLFQTRGVPGTHDVQLGLATLQSLRTPARTVLPAFDKQVDERRARASWPVAQGPLQVVLFEGWCVGARAQPAADLVEPVNRLEREEDAEGRWRRHVNERLGGDYQLLFGQLDRLLLLRAPSFDVVYEWRLEQERKLRKRVQEGQGDSSKVMDDAGVGRFISHYERITRHILTEMPARADVVIELGADRAPQRLFAGAR